MAGRIAMKISTVQRKDLSNPYFTIVSKEKEEASFDIYMESNGTDIKRFMLTVIQ